MNGQVVGADVDLPRAGTAEGEELVRYEGACPTCGEPTVMHRQRWLGPPSRMFNCEGCGEKVLAERSAGTERESPEAMRARKLEEAGIPDLGVWKRELTWEMRGEIRDWVHGRRYGKSLLVSNRQSGLGKTWACFDVAQELLAEAEDVCWIDCVSWFRETCGLLFSDEAAAEGRIRRAKGCGLLVLDDVGKQQQTARASEILWDIIDVRSRARRRRSWLTTNLDGAELAEFLGVRYETAVRRLTDGCEVWVPREDR